MGADGKDGSRRGRGPLIAGALWILLIGGGFLAMPWLMGRLADQGMSVGGAVAIAIAFLVAPFVILWLRGRSQERRAARHPLSPDDPAE